MADFREARENLDRALRLYEPSRDSDSGFRFGMDTRVGAAGSLAMPLWQLGEFDEARRLMEEATDQAVALGTVPNWSTTAPSERSSKWCATTQAPPKGSP